MLNKQAAFTLIETITVLIIIGILAIIAVPRMMNQDQFQLSLQAQQLQQDIQYVKAHALNNQVVTQLTFTNNSYQATAIVNGNSNSQALTLPSAPFDHADRSTIILPPGETISQAGLILIFNTSGQPEDASQHLIPAGQNVTINLNADGETKQITIAGQTGLVTL